MMHTRVRDLRLQPAEIVDARRSIEAAARQDERARRARRCWCSDGERIGIITKTDLADAAILRRLPIEAPVGAGRAIQGRSPSTPTISFRAR